MHPAFDFMARECTQDYKIANTNVTIQKGTPIYFSITGSLSDSAYYDQPEQFDPDRFNANLDAKNSADRPYLGKFFSNNLKNICLKYAYFYSCFFPSIAHISVFGDGPRSCIGMRFAKIQTKIGVCLLLKNFSFELGEHHLNKELVLHATSSIRTPISAIKMKLKRR